MSDYKRLTKSGERVDIKNLKSTIMHGVKIYMFDPISVNTIISNLNRLAELEDKIEQGTLIEFPRVVERKSPFNQEGCIDLDNGTTVWDLEEMKPQGVVVTRFLFESSAYKRLKELQE